MGEDYSTKPRLLYYANKIVGLDEPLYFYNHLNETSYTQSFSSKRVENVIQAVKVLSDFFSEVPNSASFTENLKVAALNSKVLLLKNWALAKDSGVRFDVVAGLYSSIPISIVKHLDGRILLYLARHGKEMVLKYFVKLGYIIKCCFK